MPPFPFKKSEFQDNRLITRDSRKFTVRFQTERRSFSLGRLCLPRSNDCHWFNVQGATGKMVYEELNIHWFPKPKTLSSLGLSKHIRSGNLSSSHNLSTDTLWLWTTPMIKNNNNNSSSNYWAPDMMASEAFIYLFSVLLSQPPNYYTESSSFTSSLWPQAFYVRKYKLL